MYKKLLTVLLPVIGEGLLFFSTSISPLPPHPAYACITFFFLQKTNQKQAQIGKGFLGTRVQ